MNDTKVKEHMSSPRESEWEEEILEPQELQGEEVDRGRDDWRGNLRMVKAVWRTIST